MNPYFAQIDSANPYTGDIFDNTDDLKLLSGLKPECETMVGYPLSMTHPTLYQDGSRFTDLSIVASLVRRDGSQHSIVLCAFEFSNFGRLFTFTDYLRFPLLRPENVNAVVNHLEAEGFRFASHELLQQKYDGLYRMADGLTMYERFFSTAF